MFLVEMDIALGLSQALSDDDITDLIQRVVDSLDDLTEAPSVGTSRDDDAVIMSIGVTVDGSDKTHAMRDGAALIVAGLATAADRRA